MKVNDLKKDTFFVILDTHFTCMNYDFQTLSIDEKIQLAEDLWKSIETERSTSLSPAQQQLLDKRILQHQQNSDKGKSWKEIRKKYFD